MSEIQKIRSLLDSQDEELRIKGLHYLKGRYDLSALQLVANALGDASWRVRKTAVDMLSEYPAMPDLFTLLIGCLRSEDNAGLRNSAAEAFEKIGKESIRPLIEVIDDEDHDLRKTVIDLLGNIGDSSVIPHLVKALNDPDENVKASAAENLGKIGDNEALKSLLDCLKTDDLLLKFSALESLCKIGRDIPVDEIIPHLTNPLLRKAAFDALGKSKDIKALDYLVKGLEDRSKSSKESALVSLVRFLKSANKGKEEIYGMIGENRKITDLVRGCLDSQSEEILTSSIQLLGWMKNVEFLPAMLKRAENEKIKPFIMDAVENMGAACEENLIDSYIHSSDAVKPFICALIGAVGKEKGVELLIGELKNSVGHIRHSSAVSLGRLEAVKAVKNLGSILDDEYEDVRNAAVQALTDLAAIDRDAVKKIVKEGVASNHLNIRKNAVKILANIGNREDIEMMLIALKDEDSEIRKEAVEALGRIEGEDAQTSVVLALNDEDRDVRITAVTCLGNMGSEELLAPLSSILQDDDIWVKCAAIQAMAQIGGERASRLIADLLKDEVGLIVIKSVQALGKLKSMEYAPAILELFESPDNEVVRAAVESLSYWNDKRYFDKLRLLLDHESWEVRNAVVKVISEKSFEGASQILKARLEIEDDPFVREQITKDL